jgi:hypothetical protein
MNEDYYKLYAGMDMWKIYNDSISTLKELEKLNNDMKQKLERWDYTYAQKMGIMKMASWFSTWCDVNFYAGRISATGGDIASWLSRASGESSYGESDREVLTVIRELYLKNYKFTDVGDMNTTLP